MLHTYFPNVTLHELQSLLEKKSDLQRLILFKCMDGSDIHTLIVASIAYGFKPQKVINTVTKLKNEGWLCTDEHYNSLISTMTETGKTSRRV